MSSPSMEYLSGKLSAIIAAIDAGQASPTKTLRAIAVSCRCLAQELDSMQKRELLKRGPLGQIFGDG